MVCVHRLFKTSNKRFTGEEEPTKNQNASKSLQAGSHDYIVFVAIVTGVVLFLENCFLIAWTAKRHTNSQEDKAIGHI